MPEHGSRPTIIALVALSFLILTSFGRTSSKSDPDASAPETTRSLIILSSSSMFGRIHHDMPLHKENSGGVGRMARYFEGVRKEFESVLTVDAGDFIHTTGPGSIWASAQVMAEALNRLGYDAWTPGERELLLGHDLLAELVRRIDAECVSANLCDSTGALLFRDRIVLMLGPLEVGVTGVTSLPPEWKGDSRLLARPEAESLAPVLSQLRQECDVVVLLAHVGAGRARELAESFPDLDLVVTGHRPGYMPSPDRVGNVPIIRNGDWGQYASFMRVDIAPDGSVIDREGRSVPLTEAMPSDSLLERELIERQHALGDTGWARR